MWKKIMAIMLLAVFAFSFSAIAGAEDSAVSSEGYVAITPFWAYTKTTSADLAINSSGKAICTAKVDGYSGTTTKITINMTLQKRGLLGLWWTDEATWSGTYSNYKATMEKTYSLTSGGTYRVKAVFTVYSGTSSESITAYSANVGY